MFAPQSCWALRPLLLQQTTTALHWVWPPRQVVPPFWLPWSFRKPPEPACSLTLLGEQQNAGPIALVYDDRLEEQELRLTGGTAAAGDGLHVEGWVGWADWTSWLWTAWALLRSSGGVGTGNGHDGDENGLGVEEHLD